MKNKKILDEMDRFLTRLLLGLAIAFMILLFFSCGTNNGLSRVEIRYRNSDSRDSIYIRDSIHVKESGDTVYMTVFKYEYKDRLRVDSVYIHIRDSVWIPVTVEKQLSKWQQLKVEVGGIAIGVIFALIMIVVWLLFKK